MTKKKVKVKPTQGPFHWNHRTTDGTKMDMRGDCTDAMAFAVYMMLLVGGMPRETTDPRPEVRAFDEAQRAYLKAAATYHALLKREQEEKAKAKAAEQAQEGGT